MHTQIFTTNTLFSKCYQTICNDIFDANLSDQLSPEKLNAIIKKYDIKDNYNEEEIKSSSKLIYICENEVDSCIFAAMIIKIGKNSNNIPIYAYIEKFVVADYVKEHKVIKSQDIRNMIIKKIKEDFRDFNQDFNIISYHK